jgi:hypothetical protein
MTLADIGAYANLLAAAGVIGSLLFVAFQIRQNNALLRAQTRQTMVERTQTELYEIVGDPDIAKAFTKPDPLNQDEWIKLTHWLIASLRQREYEWIQFSEGRLDKKLYESYRGILLIHLGPERTAKWWREDARDLGFDPDFVASVDAFLASHRPSGHFDRLAASKR